MAASSAEGQVYVIQSVGEWEEHCKKAVESKKLVVIDFTATWCGPCRFIAPIFADLAKKTPHVVFLKVDVDENKTIAEEFKVEAMPTFLLLKEGKEVERVVGADKNGLEAAIAKHGTLSASA